MKTLVCWIGKTDLDASRGVAKAGEGPIGQAVSAKSFDRVVLLSDYSKSEASAFVAWLRKKTGTRIELIQKKLSGPTEFGEIYEAVIDVLSTLTREEPGVDLVFHLSPGTPAMASVWIILSKTRFPAELIESSREKGVRTVAIPFDISAEFIPDLMRRPDEQLTRLAQGITDETPGFEDIIHRSPAMKRIIGQAQRIAMRSIPVLIEGESGTGKELMAKAIHKASPRRDKTFIAVNCGAIPADLVESEFFGHEKGAFTGATSTRQGHFEKANGGTLFLDEIGELPKPIQVKLLRALQEQEIVRIGSSTPIKINVRIIAATNRNLMEEISAGNFREDLFYRLAVAIIKLPPLRERHGDLSLLIDHLLDKINKEAVNEPGFKNKKISPSAKNILLEHSWPGNIRELMNTLQRAIVWGDEGIIGTEAVRDAILDVDFTGKGREGVLNRDLGDGFDLQEVLAGVARHYLKRAMLEAGNKKVEAARLLGFANYQTLNNWLEKYREEK